MSNKGRTYKNNEQWIEKCKEKYGDRFSYEHTEYRGSYHKVKITCIEHSEIFEVDPITFTRTTTSGNFCPECKTNKKLTNDEFIERCLEKYNSRYFFNKVKFTNIRTKVTIVCPQHGDFEKLPKAIIYDNDNNRTLCPICLKEEENLKNWNHIKYYKDNPEKGEEEGVFYKIKVTHKPTQLEFLKIGITSLSTYQRYKYSQYKEFDFLVIEETFDINLNTAILEEKYKKENKKKRFYLPEYIKFSGRTECYILDESMQLKAKQIKFIRDGLISKQNNICPICKQPLKMPTLDHHHQKKHYGDGMVRGVICNPCNRFLGLIENNILRNGYDFTDIPNILRELAEYIKKEKEPFIHPNEAPPRKKLKKSSYNKLVKAVAGKQKVPDFKDKKGNFTKPLEKLYKKYNIEPDFYKP